MHFKLIIALTEDSITDRIVDAAREQGATGSTVISSFVPFRRTDSVTRFFAMAPKRRAWMCVALLNSMSSMAVTRSPVRSPARAM